ncbi:hypothetical protein GCM10007387_08460 [Pseudoduganella albidiflava]|uniref:Uncharacterized protein n=1 Tax=Pseudoduganella albidiflava TaxID=321983 RepID=A0AA88BZC4_9BURK|nr:hypothetical protein GCM10007387_08460 [Pseudoduganella albidiflava]
MDHPAPAGLVKLSGKISNYTVTSESASFFFTRSDQTKLGLIAIAASLAEMGGQAMSVASNASAMEEEADYVRCDIDGMKVSGWLWRSPFKDGDIVDAAVEWRTDHYELLGMARPADRTVALYPHCSRSMVPHVKNAIKWWLYVSLFFDVGMLVLMSSVDEVTLEQAWASFFDEDFRWFMLGMHVVIAIATHDMTRRWAPFAKVAEKVFSTLGLPNPKSTDLVKSSKGRHQPNDSMEYGVMYFRY